MKQKSLGRGGMYHRQLKKKSFLQKENLDSLSTEYSQNSI